MWNKGVQPAVHFYTYACTTSNGNLDDAVAEMTSNVTNRAPNFISHRKKLLYVDGQSVKIIPKANPDRISLVYKSGL